MPLNATNFVPLTGNIKAADLVQFFNLFTGVMTDQPVVFGNTLMIGGNQPAGSSPLRINGVAAQTANMVEARGLGADVQPLFSVGPTGTISWGPGGSTGTDVTLRRSAANQLTLTGLAGTPALVVPVGGVTANGAIDVTGATSVKGVPQQNLLVNPGFEIWQRGNGPFTATGAYSTDRWAPTIVGSDTISISRDTSNVDNSLAAAAVTFTLGTGAGASVFHQPVGRPGDGLEQLKQRTVTVSIRVKTSTANAVRAYISADGNSTKTFSSYHSGGGTFETLTVTLALGAATDVRTGVALAASCTAYLDNATLVVGSVPMDYLPLTPADDLARCLRYYEVHGGSTNGFPFIAFSANGASHTISAPIPFAVEKAVVPTITKSGTWTVANCGQPIADLATTKGYRFYVISTAAGGGNAQPSGASDTLAFEANP
jgi:hypothetical protein